MFLALFLLLFRHDFPCGDDCVHGGGDRDCDGSADDEGEDDDDDDDDDGGDDDGGDDERS